jgi:hypothetical protein
VIGIVVGVVAVVAFVVAAVVRQVLLPEPLSYCSSYSPSLAIDEVLILSLRAFVVAFHSRSI